MSAAILPLAVEGLGFGVAGRVLLRDVGFVLPPGGITALLGPNGAGKSLTLRLCQGLLAPSAGRLVWAAPPDGRRAMVFQKPVMLRRSTAANLVHALAAAGLGWRARRARAGTALARFGLEALAGQAARLLSGGEQQRLAIARAWALAPQLLLLDEPTAQLDPTATRLVEEMLLALAAEGMTIVLATHDLGQVRRLASRVLFLHRGRLEEDRPAEAFLAAPRSPAARAFLAGELPW